MFNHTTIDNRAKSSINNIDGYFIDANNDFNNEYLSLVLGSSKDLLRRYNSWYSINDKLYFFKDVLIFNELFLSELVKEYNLRSVNYHLASINGEVGIISESIKDKNKKYFDYDCFFELVNGSVPSSIGEIKQIFQNRISDSNGEELIRELFRLTAFDFFTSQTDRSEKNIIFELDKSGIRLAKLFDFGTSLQSSNNINDYSVYNSSFETLRFPTDNNVSYEHEYLFYLINNNAEFYRYLCKSLDIDIHKVLKNTIEKYHLFVPNSDKKELFKFFDTKKKIIENTLTLSKSYK